MHKQLKTICLQRTLRTLGRHPPFSHPRGWFVPVGGVRRACPTGSTSPRPWRTWLALRATVGELAIAEVLYGHPWTGRTCRNWLARQIDERNPPSGCCFENFGRDDLFKSLGFKPLMARPTSHRKKPWGSAMAAQKHSRSCELLLCLKAGASDPRPQAKSFELHGQPDGTSKPRCPSLTLPAIAAAPLPEAGARQIGHGHTPGRRNK